MKNKLSVPDRHQVAVAKKTLWMPDAILGVLGGMNKVQAREVLRVKAGWNNARICKYEGGK